MLSLIEGPLYRDTERHHLNTQLLIHGFEGLTKVCIRLQEITLEVILAILTCRETLEHALTYDPIHGFYEHDGIQREN